MKPARAPAPVAPAPWTSDETAAALGVHPVTLRRWRSQGYGPAYLTTPTGRIRYYPGVVRSWIERNHGAR